MLTLVLASASPRRRRLLTEAGYRFEVLPTEAPEVSDGADPAGCVVANALAKNEAARRQRPDAAILSADTVVWRSGRMLGKPKTHDEAVEMLSFLSGKGHTVFTGVAITRPGVAEPSVRVEASEVRFRTLSAADIDGYIAKVKPFDRAGAYDLSDFGEIVVEKVVGSYTNVIGLPMEAVKSLLSDAGIAPAAGFASAAPAAEFPDAALCHAAAEAAKLAYAPYSGYRVGAALLAADGRVFTGCNVENASYGLTNCAERTALFKAVSEGVRNFKAIAIAGGTDSPAYPCGACRQALAEFCGQETPVICCTLDGKVAGRFTLGGLLPQTFAL
ncbi:MAG: cytidine deaminase [Kiritimatiellae bacterium]|nr:cytidine deaminase [Kiritimatiellia bacterium]